MWLPFQHCFLVVLVTLLFLCSTSAFQVPQSSKLAAVRSSRCSTAASKQLLFQKRTLLFQSYNENSNEDDDIPYKYNGDSLVFDTALALKRTSWLSWWAQVILTTVSSVTLLFARNVVKQTVRTSMGANGFFLAGSGLVVSFVSIFWTWGGARLARRLVKRDDTTRTAAANMLRRDVRVAAYLNILGIFLTVLGAEQIIGGLAIKVLTMQGVIGAGPGSAAVATQTLQPLDILIVQANTNTLLSHFCGLVLSLYLTKYIDLLDPPSVEDDKRKNKK